MIHIADHLPYTHVALKEELAQAEAHLKLVKGALEKFEAAESTFSGELTPNVQRVEFEVVCPQEHPQHFQGRGFDVNLAQCAKDAQQAAHRNGPLYAFLNVGGASIAISPSDFPHLKFHNHEKDGQVCWTKTKRKTVWLT